MTAALAWGSKVSGEFRSKVASICSAIGIADPSWLMACIAFETGRTFSPSIRNPASSATGLIQFMESTASRLLTTTDELARMSDVEQLDYVFRYLRPYAGRIENLGDCYMSILYPVAVGKPDDFVLFASPAEAYAANKGLDFNRDGAVTRGECVSVVERVFAEGMRPENVAAIGAPGMQAPAPIEDKSTPLPQLPEEPMGAIAIPLLAQLIPQVLGLFTGRAQAQIAKATGASPDASAAFMQNLIGLVGQATGIPVVDSATAVQAVAAVTSNPEPAKIAKIEEGALDYLDKLAPILDKMAAQELAIIAASSAAMDAAGARGRLDKVDIAPQLVSNGTLDFRGALIGIIALLGVQMYFDKDHKPDATLTGFLGLFTYGVIRLMDRPSAYRFGGAFDSPTADTTRAVVNQAISDRKGAQS